MSLDVKSITPTQEELDFLREKLNEIADIPIDPQITNKISILSKKLNLNNDDNDNNNNILNNNENINKSIKNLINNESQTFNFNNESNENLFLNKNNNENEELKNNNINNNNEIENYLLNSEQKKNNFQNYQSNSKENFEIEKIKYENILLKNKIEEQNKKIEEYSKKLNLTKFINNNKNLLSSDYIKLSLLKLINENKTNEEFKNLFDRIFFNNNENKNYLEFLFNRIENLEFQNFSLINQIEYYIKIIIEMSNDLIEYINILEDIKNVLNNIQEGKKLNEDFFIIRNTLNKKNEIINIQKNEILNRKNYIEFNDIIKKNENLMFCNDKIIEMKLINNKNKINYEKSFEILNEKITTYENLKELYEKYEDYLNFIEKSNVENFVLEKNFKIKDELINFNNLLMKNNLILKNVLINLIKEKKIDYDENIKNILNNYKHQSFLYEDFFFMLINQSKINEKNILKNNF